MKHPYLVETLNNCTIGPCTQLTGFFAQPANCDVHVLSERLGLASPGATQDCTDDLDAGLAAYSNMLETLAGLLGPAPRTASQQLCSLLCLRALSHASRPLIAQRS